MPRQKTGSIFTRKDRPGLWIKVPYQDETGRTRYLQRRVESSVKGRPAGPGSNAHSRSHHYGGFFDLQ